jgi:hypothetical protein
MLRLGFADALPERLRDGGLEGKYEVLFYELLARKGDLCSRSVKALKGDIYGNIIRRRSSQNAPGCGTR